MIQTDSVPEATAPPEHHADFLELSTLRSVKKSVSVQEFIRDLGIGNADEAVADSLDDDDAENQKEAAEAIAQTAFDELDERCRNFGTHSAHYPFDLTDNTLNLKSGGEESLYTFLCLLSWFGKDAGPSHADGEKIFEDVSRFATRAIRRKVGELF